MSDIPKGFLGRLLPEWPALQRALDTAGLDWHVFEVHDAVPEDWDCLDPRCRAWVWFRKGPATRTRFCEGRQIVLTDALGDLSDDSHYLIPEIVAVVRGW